MRCVWAILVLAGLAAREARGCGLHWSKPVNHFDGVCEEGYVSHWEDWGTVDFGDGLKLPLIVGFRSDRNTDSPYLGRGWIVALLESHAYALDERKLRVVMPDGYHYTFRKQKNGVWDGNRGWLGEFKGNTFTAWAPCGWKIQWRDGKIQTIWTDKARRIDYRYTGSMCSAIMEGGAPRLRVEPDAANNEIKTLVFRESASGGDDQRITVNLGSKPELDRVNGSWVVGNVSKSLASAKWLNGQQRQRQYEFGFEEGLRPTLVAICDQQSPKRLSWTPGRGLVFRTDDWLYTIEPSEDPSYPGIRRQNARTGKEEFYLMEPRKGKQISVKDDAKTIREWFVNGPAKNQLRRVGTEGPEGQIVDEERYFYDGFRLMRKERNGFEVHNAKYDEAGLLTEETYGGLGREDFQTMAVRYEYNEDGQLEEITVVRNEIVKAPVVRLRDGRAVIDLPRAGSEGLESSGEQAIQMVLDVKNERSKEDK